MNVPKVFVVEAKDLSLGEISSDVGLPGAEVTWPDGRVDQFPQYDEEVDLVDFIADRSFLHFSFTNEMATFPGFDKADLVRLGDDVWHSHISTDFGIDRHYLRGTFKSVVQHWL